MTPAEEFEAAVRRLRPAHTTGELLPRVLIHPEPVAELLEAFAELAAAYPEMAHDHDRPACDDYACDVMGRATDLARLILGTQPDGSSR